MNRGQGPSDFILIRMMDGSPVASNVLISPEKPVITLQSGGMGSVPQEIDFEVLPENLLRIRCAVDGHEIEMLLRKKSREDFLLINRWINEFPFNR